MAPRVLRIPSDIAAPLSTVRFAKRPENSFFAVGFFLTVPVPVLYRHAAGSPPPGAAIEMRVSTGESLLRGSGRVQAVRAGFAWKRGPHSAPGSRFSHPSHDSID